MNWRRASRHAVTALAVGLALTACSDGLDPETPDPADDERLPPATDTRVEGTFSSLPVEP
jgi:hypothetical protein